MNSSQTEDFLKSNLSPKHTSRNFYPDDTIWVHCLSHTYHPHSNECGPRSLLALSIMALHPIPSKNILLPYMHHNIAQICQWWVAKTIIASSFDRSPFLPTPECPTNTTVSRHQDSFPSDIAPIHLMPPIDHILQAPLQLEQQIHVNRSVHPNNLSSIPFTTKFPPIHVDNNHMHFFPNEPIMSPFPSPSHSTTRNATPSKSQQKKSLVNTQTFYS